MKGSSNFHQDFLSCHVTAHIWEGISEPWQQRTSGLEAQGWLWIPLGLPVSLIKQEHAALTLSAQAAYTAMRRANCTMHWGATAEMEHISAQAVWARRGLQASSWCLCSGIFATCSARPNQLASAWEHPAGLMLHFQLQRTLPWFTWRKCSVSFLTAKSFLR